MSDVKPIPKVYQCINKVQAALSKDGIAKDQKNTQQNWKFRGIDDVYNALAPVLAEHGLCILPKVLSRSVVERTTKSGGVMFYVTLEVEYILVCAEDGSAHSIVTIGEAMDSGDKATNKALSAAYKYACLQTFCIPIEGDSDADATTHEVKPNTPLPPKAPVTPPKAEAAATAESYAKLMDWIDAKQLQDAVPKWLAYYKVNDLAQLSDIQIKQLIVTIQKKDQVTQADIVAGDL